MAMLAPTSPTLQDAKGPLLLGMVTKNMDFQSRLPYHKISKQKIKWTCDWSEVTAMSRELW